MYGSNKMVNLLEEEFGGHEDEPGGSKNRILIGRDWEADYKNSLKNIDDLSKFLALNEEEKIRLKRVTKLYHMRVPLYYFSLIQEPDNAQDPIKRQCIPSLEELHEEGYETIDPLGEEKTSPVSCLVHRYPDRVLLLVTGRCFMYCRHCTRKRLWREKTPEPTLKDIEQALSYINDNRQIREAIISGGDPLTLSTERLDYILFALSRIENIEVIRIGTRAPVVLPQRVDKSLCKVLEKYEKVWINVQFNHPREVTPQSSFACKELQKCGIPVSNQSVLLKGINENPQVMMELCHKLQSIRVRPYYLFQCDPVVGTSHFRTSVWKGIGIIEKMRGYTGGMCVPTFVVDGIDGKGKVPLEPNYLISTSNEGVVLRNYKNESFFYHSPEGKSEARSEAKRCSSIKTVGIAFNLKKKGVFDDRYEEYDDFETIECLREEIEKLGFEVQLFEQNGTFLKDILEKRPDFVFNIAEGKGNTKGRESQVPGILESVDIPYSGSDPISLGLTLDKYLTNRILKSADIPVPLMFMVRSRKELEALENIFKKGDFFIIKPRWEGSSKGIFLNSLVNNFEQLKERAMDIFLKYCQPALVEEFLEKEEITVGVCGNTPPYILGMMKIVPRDLSQKRFIYSVENKRDWQKKIKYEPQETISHHIRTQISDYALKAFSALELRDVARIDFRIDKDDIPKIIDVNPLPGLSPSYGDLPILYRLRGGSYPDLIRTILKESFIRYSFEQP